MKRLFTLFTGLCVLLLAGCNDEYDDSALVKRLDDLEQRLEKLEKLCNTMNTNLGSMQTIVKALEGGDYITSVDPLTENGSVVGYTIRFAKGTPIVVYNGKAGTTPVIAVKKDTDGIYYWTLNDQWLTDDHGAKLPVSGQNGTSPKLKIEDEYWYISYDDGTTWTKLDKATGEKGDDGAGILVEMDENYVYFTLPNGTKFTVPRVGGGSDPEPSVPHILYAVGQESVPDTDYFYATVWRDGKRFPLSDGSADAFCNAVCTGGDDVYVVGCEAIGDLIDDGYYEPYHQNVAVLWHFKTGDEANAARQTLSDGKYATSPVAVAVSNGNVYAAGFETPAFDRRAVWWKNGQMEYLTDGSTDALAYCILADGDDVYVGGYVQPADNKRGGIARIWKNGTAQDLTDGTTLAKVNALCMDNGVLYAAGAEKTTEGRWKGVLWRDGQPTYFTDEVGTEVTGLYVKDGKYIIEGNMTDASSNVLACIWTNDGVQILSENLSLCQGVGLAVAGSDVYVAGNEAAGFDYTTFEEINRAYVWKNGEVQTLETISPDNMSLWGLACAFVDEKQ